MKITIDMLDGDAAPKRGDLLQTNAGDRRERTCFVLAVHRLKPIKGAPRFRLWAERWWELEEDFRRRLFESAERAGGQEIIHFRRYKTKKPKNRAQLRSEMLR